MTLERYRIHRWKYDPGLGEYSEQPTIYAASRAEAKRIANQCRAKDGCEAEIYDTDRGDYV